MADFHYYLNRQGTRGQRGEKGDTGFSPLITEKTNTKEEYVLHIQNETDDTSFDTPNLKEGLVPEDMGGTYVRLNRETGNQYYGDIDSATETVAGVVKLEPEETVLNPASETSVLTAQSAVNNYGLKTDVQKLQENIYVSAVGVQDKLLRVGYSKNGVFDHASLIELPSGSGDVSSAGNNKFTGDNTFTGKVNIAGGTLTVDGLANLNQTTAQYLNAVNITSTGEVNAASIKATGLRSDDIQTTENKKYLTELDVDNQTIQVVEGKLHANLDELGNEVNDLTGRVTGCESDILTMKTSIGMKQTKLTAGANIILTDLTDGTVRIDATGGGGTGDVPIATTTTAGKVKPDGTTITITDDGTISAVGGGGSAPTNMMTTDTDQLITGIKDFSVDWNKPSENGLFKGLKAGVLALGNDTGTSCNYGVIGLDTGQGFKLKLDGDAAITVNHGTYYGESTVVISGHDVSHPATISGIGALSLKAAGGNDKGLQITTDGVSFTNSAGETKDLLAGNVPTIIDGGDSTTT